MPRPNVVSRSPNRLRILAPRRVEASTNAMRQVAVPNLGLR
jgi:hypothetical protein